MSEVLDGTPVPVTPVVPAPVAAETATDTPVEGDTSSAETPEQKHAKTIAKMERRISTLTARTAQERAEKELLRQQLEQVKAKPAEEAEPEAQKTHKTALELAREMRDAERVTEKANRVASEGKKEFPDFMDRVGELQAALGPQFDRSGRPTPLMDAILESDAPAKVLHHIASDLDLAAELAAMSPHRMTRRLVQLESELTDKPKTSRAPEPLKPVKASVTASEPDPENTKAWIEARNKALRNS